MISRFISADLEVLAVSPSREAGDRGELSEKAEWMPIPEMILKIVSSFIVGNSTFFLPVLRKCLLNIFVHKKNKCKRKTRKSKLSGF